MENAKNKDDLDKIILQEKEKNIPILVNSNITINDVINNNELLIKIDWLDFFANFNANSKVILKEWIKVKIPEYIIEKIKRDIN